MLKNAVYKKGEILVTPNLFKTAKRTYQISRIERIQIKRPLFIFSLPISLFSFLLLNNYFDYLYLKEVFICCFLMTGLPLVAYNIGTLSVTSKSYTSDNAITGYMPILKDVRGALESVLYDSQSREEVSLIH